MELGERKEDNRKNNYTRVISRKTKNTELKKSRRIKKNNPYKEQPLKKKKSRKVEEDVEKLEVEVTINENLEKKNSIIYRRGSI